LLSSQKKWHELIFDTTNWGFTIWSGGYRLVSREIVCPLVIAYDSGTALKCTWNPSMKVSITHGAPNNIFSIILLQNCKKTSHHINEKSAFKIGCQYNPKPTKLVYFWGRKHC
jgi:hypothetical protein